MVGDIIRRIGIILVSSQPGFVFKAPSSMIMLYYILVPFKLVSIIIWRTFHNNDCCMLIVTRHYQIKFREILATHNQHQKQKSHSIEHQSILLEVVMWHRSH
jgi:hypothetical protein